jgi:hypothetical protein
MRRLALVAVGLFLFLAAPAEAAGLGKRFAHNRGVWTGGQPIEVVGSVSRPLSITVRVRWRTLEQPQQPAPQPPAQPPEQAPDDKGTTEGFKGVASPIPGGGIALKWRMICPLGTTRAARRAGSFTTTSSPDLQALPLPRRDLPHCQVIADAKGPRGVIGKIMLDLYATA